MASIYPSLLLLLAFLTAIAGNRIHDIGHEFINPFTAADNKDDNSPLSGEMEVVNLSDNPEERPAEYWKNMAQEEIIRRINRPLNKNKAKNIILFIGDGMSIPTLMAARTYKGQKEGLSGEEQSLSFEKFPYVGLSKTYCANRQVADSACTSTAYMCGVKANFMTLGISAEAALNDCAASENPAYQVDSIAKWAQDAGKSTGIVTTTRVTNASPAGGYAHISNRKLESDYDSQRKNVSGCTDIAKQLMTRIPGRDFNVIMGGGRIKFQPKGPEGERFDGRNFIKEWQMLNPKGKYITTRKELLQLSYAKIDKILGLFASSTLAYATMAPAEQPSLKEMTESAIRLLSRNERGYFLFVEGGRIDHAHHKTKAVQALEETLEFANAIERAREMTSESDTLIVVSSDHSHTMSISGYPLRGSNITGLSDFKSDIDKLKYATLSYANGPERYLDPQGNRLDLTNKLKPTSSYPANVPRGQETHGGDDVAVFASGPYAHLFSGLYEQHFIPHMMAYAACVGNGKTACDSQSGSEEPKNILPEPSVNALLEK